jgi:hypothetical protein
MHNSLGDNQIFLELGNGINAESIVISRSGSEFKFSVQTDSSSIQSRTTSYNMLKFTSTWQHVIWSIYGLNWMVLIDSILRISSVNTHPVQTRYGNNFLGYGSAPSTPFLDADIDDVRMYNRRLEYADCVALYENNDCCTSTAGEYVGNSDTCDGTLYVDKVPCMNCISDCGYGNYISDPSTSCTGIGLLDSTHCKRCRTCAPGEHMAGVCDGTGYSDTVLCAPCVYTTSADCYPNTYIYEPCTGATERHTPYCMGCNIACQDAVDDPNGLGQYISKMCTYDEPIGTCTRCSGSCEAGNFIASKCNGKSPEDTSCTRCKNTCSPGRYLYGTCDGSSTTDTITCQPCTQCLGDFSVDRVCDGRGTSSSNCIPCPPTCASGQYVLGTCGIGQVVSCHDCSPACTTGFIESVACTTTTNRVCVPSTTCTQDCPTNQYQISICYDMYTPKVCAACSSCGAGFFKVSECTSTSNVKCAPCTAHCILSQKQGPYTNSMSGSCDGSGTTDEVSCYNRDSGFHEVCPYNQYLNPSFVPLGNSDVINQGWTSDNWAIGPLGTLMVTWKTTNMYMYTVLDDKIVRLDYADINLPSDCFVGLNGDQGFDQCQAMGLPSGNTALGSYVTSVTIVGDDAHLIIFHPALPGLGFKCPTYGFKGLDDSCSYFTQADTTYPTRTPTGCIYMYYGWMACIVYSTNTAWEIIAFNTNADRWSGRTSRKWHSMIIHQSVSSDPRLFSLQLAYDPWRRTLFWIVGDYDGNGMSENLIVQSCIIWLAQTTIDNPGTVYPDSYVLGRTLTDMTGLPFSQYAENLVYDRASDSLIDISGKWMMVIPFPYFDKLWTICLDGGDCDSVVESDFMMSPNGAIIVPMGLSLNQYTRCSNCPSTSQSSSGSTALSDCVCGAGTYGTLTDDSSICYDCIKQSAGDSCGSGMYSTGNLCGAGSTSDVTCVSCTTSCSMNYYLTNACTGIEVSNTAVCTACVTTCPTGSYVNPNTICGGQDTFDAVQCLPCKNECGSGSHLSGTCTGTTNFDNVKCLPCTACGMNTYTQKPCSGTRLSYDHDDTECIDCSFTPESCPLTLTQQCTGSETSDVTIGNCAACTPTCATDEFVSRTCSKGRLDDFECTKCKTQCNSLYYISGPCDGTTTEDTQCTACTSSCAVGYRLGFECHGDESHDTTGCWICDGCPTGSYQFYSCTGFDYKMTECAVCNVGCPVGEYTGTPCDALTDRKCEFCKTSCPAGHYMQGSCDGTASSDTVICIPCHDCDAGHYIDNAEVCDGYNNINTNTCSECLSACDPGQYIYGNCDGSSTSDVQSCSACRDCIAQSMATQYDSIYGSCSGQYCIPLLVCY